MPFREEKRVGLKTGFTIPGFHDFNHLTNLNKTGLKGNTVKDSFINL